MILMMLTMLMTMAMMLSSDAPCPYQLPTAMPPTNDAHEELRTT
jgi:hypothetical protein